MYVWWEMFTPKDASWGVEADMYLGFNGLFQFWSQTIIVFRIQRWPITTPLTFRFQWPHCALYVYRSVPVQVPPKTWGSSLLYKRPVLVVYLSWLCVVLCESFKLFVFPTCFFFQMGSSYPSRGKPTQVSEARREDGCSCCGCRNGW